MKFRILVSCLFLLFIPFVSAQVYTITDLGPLSPTAINAWGQVVGNLNGEAFIWTQFAGRKGLGKLTGGTSSSASSINDLGVVTGTADGPGTVISPYSSTPNQVCTDLTQPFVWAPRSGIQGLGTVVFTSDPGYPWCDLPFYASGINDLGQVVGYGATGPNFFQYAFLWTSADGMTSFGGSFPPTEAYGVSNTGKIVGQNSISVIDIGHATWWKNGVSTDLGTLGGGPDVVFYSSLANGVNDLGQIVGWSTTASISMGGCSDFFVPGGCPMHAVLWTPSGAISDLGTLPGDTLSAASKINIFGLVIGSSGNTIVQVGQSPSSPQVIGRPFIWSERNGMQDLNTLISGNPGWMLSSATGINLWGQIVGSGTLHGHARGFLLTPTFF